MTVFSAVCTNVVSLDNCYINGDSKSDRIPLYLEMPTMYCCSPSDRASRCPSRQSRPIFSLTSSLFVSLESPFCSSFSWLEDIALPISSCWHSNRLLSCLRRLIGSKLYFRAAATSSLFVSLESPFGSSFSWLVDIALPVSSCWHSNRLFVVLFESLDRSQVLFSGCKGDFRHT